MTRRVILLTVGLIGFAGVALPLLTSSGLARSYLLEIAQNAAVISHNGARQAETIVVDGHRHAVYELSGDSAKQPKCTSSKCLRFWPALTVANRAGLSAEPGIPGKLSVWKHDGFLQVTLGGHPLHTFSFDKQKQTATGQGIKSFGGTWHVIRLSSGSPSSSTTTATTTSSTATSTRTSTATSSSTMTSTSASSSSTYTYPYAVSGGAGG